MPLRSPGTKAQFERSGDSNSSCAAARCAGLSPARNSLAAATACSAAVLRTCAWIHSSVPKSARQSPRAMSIERIGASLAVGTPVRMAEARGLLRASCQGGRPHLRSKRSSPPAPFLLGGALFRARPTGNPRAPIHMAKQMVFESDAREAIRRGVEKLAKAVTTTLGPRGRNAILDKGWGAPTVTKDGVTVAEEIQLADPYEHMGAQLVKEVASKTSDVAGDGTTTATLLTE